MTAIAQDRLVAKEVSLGVARERAWPQNHMGLQMFPLKHVDSDDVIFEFIQENGTGLAPARAEDAESEMAKKEGTLGEGRASIIDWAVKDHYSPSDISRFKESIYIAGQMGTNLPLTVSNIKEGFELTLARDAGLRRRRLDNRLEWLIMQALWTGAITYNDGKVQFSVDFGRPNGNNVSASAWWSGTSSDPIADIFNLQETAYNNDGITLTKAIASRKIIRNILNSSKFAARTGLAGSSGPASAVIDPKYVIDGWGVEAAVAVVERATGVKFTVYDAIYRTRTPGSTSLTNNRFSPEDKVLFLPDDADINEIDDMIGFGKTLTSPHPEGNWASGFYEWEKDTGPDPWGHDVGTGIKAFPVFPHMELSYIMRVI